MQNNSLFFIKLLSAAISNTPPELPEVSPDWQVIYKEAIAHQVHTLLFPVIEELPEHLQPEPALLETWRYEMLREGAFQIMHLDQMERVFQYFHNQSIPLIALKGLILRKYYPLKELRIMRDADVLVHSEDLIKAHEALLKLGYKRGKSSERHITYTHERYPEIELHTILTDNAAMESKGNFTSHVWENTITELLDSAPVLSLSVKDQIIHQIFHIVHHICSSGIGLRQLCDFTLFASAHSNDIIWDNILYEVELYGYDKFTQTLLAICHDLFDLPLPEDILPEADEQFIFFQDKLTEDILEAGAFGKRTKERAASRNLLRYIKDGQDAAISEVSASKISAASHSDHKKIAFFNVVRFLFPVPANLGYQYRYAKRYPVLLPAAWIHRGFYNIGQLSLLAFIWDKETSAAYSDRIKLLTWLKLR